MTAVANAEDSFMASLLIDSKMYANLVSHQLHISAFLLFHQILQSRGSGFLQIYVALFLHSSGLLVIHSLQEVADNLHVGHFLDNQKIIMFYDGMDSHGNSRWTVTEMASDEGAREHGQ